MAQMTECDRCNGKGHINGYAHVMGGVCFKCAGSGKQAVKKVRKPSPAQLAKKAAQEAERDAAAAAHKAKLEALMNDPRIWASPRMRVTPEHPYAYMHVLEVAAWHEKYGW